MASLKRTNPSMSVTAQARVDPTDADGKWQLGPPAAANDEKTRTHRRGLQAACTDGCPRRTVQFQQSAGRGSAQRRQGERESSGSQSVDQCEHAVPKVGEERLLLPSQHHHVEALARPVAQHQNSGEKEKTSVMALLRHVHLP